MRYVRLIVHELHRIANCLCGILELLRRMTTAHSATLTLRGITMPVTMQIGQTATAVLHEFTGPNGTGTELPPIGPVAYTSSDPSVASVDMASGVVTAVAPGTATITGTDGGNSLSASDSVTVATPVAVSATLVITPNP